MKSIVKRTVCLICNFVLLVSCVSGMTLSASTAEFRDVSATAWYTTAVRFVCDADYMQGMGNHYFKPGEKVSRAMLATVLYRMSGSNASYNSSSFKDNQKGKWHFNGIEYCARMGIVKGYGNGNFGTDDFVTRQDMMTMLYRYALKQGLASNTSKTPLSTYTDRGQVASYAQTPVNWCLDAGVINGDSYTTVSPKATATRAQLAQVLMNFCERVLGVDVSAYRKSKDNPYGIGVCNVRLYKEELSFRLNGLEEVGELKMKVTYKLGQKICATEQVTIAAKNTYYSYKGKASSLYRSKDPNHTGTDTWVSATVQLYHEGKSILSEDIALGKVFQQSPNQTPLYFKGERTIDCRILLYHEFIRREPIPSSYGTVSTPERFEEHMQYLLKNGYTVIPLYALLEYHQGIRALPQKAVVLTFDDGYASNYSMIYPILKKYNLPATIFVVINSMNKSDRLTWAQMREMEQSGLVDIQSHSMRHVDHSELSSGLLHEYIGNSFETLDQQLGKQKYRILAYPFGKYSSTALQIGQHYHAVMQMSTRWGAVDMNHLDLTQLPRINIAHDSNMADVMKIKIRT